MLREAGLALMAVKANVRDVPVDNIRFLSCAKRADSHDHDSIDSGKQKFGFSNGYVNVVGLQ